MIIAVDIGNSAAKAALVEGALIRERRRLDTSVASTADLAVSLRLLAGNTDEPPTRIMAVSVVDPWTERLERAADELGLPLIVVAASNIPISTALLRSDQTGSDRLLAAWAAATLHGRPVIVVDLGTATTVDAVDGDGFFLGGAILPGLSLAADALAEGTARLPRVNLDLPGDAIGVDTLAALQSGVVIGHVGAVRELVVRMREHIATSGASTAPTAPSSAGPTAASSAGPTAPSSAGPTAASSAGPTAPSPAGPTAPSPAGPTAPSPAGPTAPSPAGPTAPSPAGPTVTGSASPSAHSGATVVVTGGHAAATWAHRAWREAAGPTLPAVADVLDAELVLRGLGLLAEYLVPRPSAGAAR